jgi:adenine-specific DNA-methyltransferase
MSEAVKRVETILKSEFEMNNYVGLIREIFSTVRIVEPERFRAERSNFSSHVEGSYHVGNYETPDEKKIAVFAVQLKQRSYVENSRSTQRSYAKKLIENGNCDAALIAYYTPNDKEKKWRLSFVRLDYDMKIENGRMTTEENLTPAKRYSFLVGEGEPCHTAIDRFRIFITDHNSNPTLEELEEAFSVEAVTKEFFNLYCEKFYQLVEFLEGNKVFKEESERCGFSTEQFAKKLMGQIVFLYFLQKKGWLGVGVWKRVITEKEYKSIFYSKAVSGAQRQIIQQYLPTVYVPDGEDYIFKGRGALERMPKEVEELIANCMPGDRNWGSGSKKFLRTWFDYAKENGGHFYDKYLEPLFYATLNTNRGELGYSTILHCRIPFLSGGLFEPIDGYDWEHCDFDIPDEIFSNKTSDNDRTADGILDIFDRYNFTMSEDEPMEREVAIDPEMLGKVFENLLDIKDRKSKGAFYTPREIVHYMCQECLVNYLTTNIDISEAAIRDFILYGDFYKDTDTEKTLRVTEPNGKIHYEFDTNKPLKISPEIFSLKDGVNRVKEIDELLKNIRVADPAVGSGAFPLGMLNEIVRARQNLSAYMATSMSLRDARFMYVNERSAHTLKYETIRNCIFAADIEPSAVDIAQLRLWLALVIDDEINPDAQTIFDGHRNPLPLPNLECNIVCGNSLIDEFEGHCLIPQCDLLGTERGSEYSWNQMALETLIPKLVDAQDRLFRCDEPIKKAQIKEEVITLKDQIIRTQLELLPSESLTRYEESKYLSSKPYVLWQVDFARVFKEKKGFDVVIGNPPYRLCQPSNTSEFYLNYYKSHYKVASYKIDLFHLFFERGINLLKEGGILSYITPNTYLTNKYIKPLRQFIVENCRIYKIINHDKVFDSASVDTATIIMSKEKVEDTEISVMRSSNFVFDEICKKQQKDWMSDKEFIFNININNEETMDIGDCITLGEVCKTYFGIQAYDRKTSISAYEENEHYLPFIDGADIHPYTYAEPKIFFNYLPENIKSGGDWKVYSQDRVVVRQIGQIPVVGLCKKNILASNTLYSVWPKDEKYDLKFILACLNSDFIKNYWKAKYSDNKALFPKIKGFQLKELPLPRVPRQQQETVIKMVEKILEIKENDETIDTSEIEVLINAMVNEMYSTK